MQLQFLTKNESLINSVTRFIKEWNSESTHIEVKTSGSTGAPKRILLDKKHVFASAKMTGDFLNLKPNQNALLCLSPETIAGKMMIARSIVLELNLFVVDVTGRPLQGVSERMDFIAMVPLQLENTIQLDHAKLFRGQKVIVGGGDVNQKLKAKILVIPSQVFHSYGMTETVSHIAMRNLSNGEIAYNTLPSVSISTLVDCLVIDAPHIGVRELITNDIIELLSPTSFRWKGRKDFVINSGGVKIHPEEVEKAIAPIMDHAYFSTGIDDDHLGQKHILCVEGTQFDLTKSSFSKYLHQHYIPKEIYFFNKFHYTTSNKIDRLATLKELSNVEKKVL